jgi:hypothetical protein
MKTLAPGAVRRAFRRPETPSIAARLQAVASPGRRRVRLPTFHPIDSPPAPQPIHKEPSMNTTRTHSFAAFGAAAFLTLAMLLSIHTLAQVEAASPQLAQAATARA